MWPYTEREAKWLSAQMDGYRVERSPEFPPELIAYYMRRGREMQSEVAMGLLARLVAAVGRMMRRTSARGRIGNAQGASLS